jgi:hypothetical protein
VADAIARDARIEWAAPGAPKNFDRLGGIERLLSTHKNSSEFVTSTSSSTTTT